VKLSHYTNHIFFKLLSTRLLILRPYLFDKIFNLCVWAFCSLVVYGYVMQQMGLASNFGLFSLAGIIATAGLFEMYGSVVSILLDFESERSISYYLTLPTTPRIVLLSMIGAYACQGFLLTMAMFPLGKLIFFNSLNLSAIHWPKFFVMAVLANIFYAALVPAIAASVKTIARMGNIWSRFIFPMWFLGGFQFSWTSILNVSKPLAYFLLCNPVIYIMEGIRASVLGQTGYLPWELCVAVLSGFCIISWMLSYRNMKKLLDFV
jgi:ABC-type polysaccharide/polyol phosphate export permease